MNIEETFSQIITKLQNDQRPLIKLTDDDHASLRLKWTKIIDEKKYEELVKILCILDNTITLSRIHEDNIIQTLLDAPNEIVVLTLGVARKHLIEAYHKDSLRLPLAFLECLRKMLSSKNPETLEWSLRLIESLGSQSIFLKDSVYAMKPSFFSALTNQHMKNSKQIIELLEKRWSYSK